MMLGPCRAPSSPPDTPVPRKRSPREARACSRRTVSSKKLLPPSMSRSPSSRFPTSSPSSPWRSSSSRVRDSVRLWTATGNPWRAALRARFAPMVARPVTPSSHCPAIEGPPQPRRARAVQARYRNECQACPPGGPGRSGVGGGRAHPAQVRGAAVVDGDGGQLRRLVAVVGLDVGGQGVEAGGGGLDQAQPLVRALDRPPPAVG